MPSLPEASFLAAAPLDIPRQVLTHSSSDSNLMPSSITTILSRPFTLGIAVIRVVNQADHQLHTKAPKGARDDELIGLFLERLADVSLRHASFSNSSCAAVPAVRCGAGIASCVWRAPRRPSHRCLVGPQLNHADPSTAEPPFRRWRDPEGVHDCVPGKQNGRDAAHGLAVSSL